MMLYMLIIPLVLVALLAFILLGHQDVAAVSVASNRICVNCHQPVQNDWTNCPYCGHALQMLQVRQVSSTVTYADCRFNRTCSSFIPAGLKVLLSGLKLSCFLFWPPLITNGPCDANTQAILLLEQQQQSAVLYFSGGNLQCQPRGITSLPEKPFHPHVELVGVNERANIAY